MKRDKPKFLLLLLAIVTPANDGPPPDDNANRDALDARMRELLRPIFPQQFLLH